EENNIGSSDNENDNSKVIANTQQSEAINSNSNKIGNTAEQTDPHLVSEDSDRRNTTTKINSQVGGIAASQKNKTGISNSKEDIIAKNTPNLPQLNSNKEAKNQGHESIKTILENEKEGTTIAKTSDQNTVKKYK